MSGQYKFWIRGKQGEISLSAELDEELDEDCVLRITVTDTGIGISEEQQSRVFQSFEQADGGISRKFGGSWVGHFEEYY